MKTNKITQFLSDWYGVFFAVGIILSGLAILNLSEARAATIYDCETGLSETNSGNSGQLIPSFCWANFLNASTSQDLQISSFDVRMRNQNAGNNTIIAGLASADGGSWCDANFLSGASATTTITSTTFADYRINIATTTIRAGEKVVFKVGAQTSTAGNVYYGIHYVYAGDAVATSCPALGQSWNGGSGNLMRGVFYGSTSTPSSTVEYVYATTTVQLACGGTTTIALTDDLDNDLVYEFLRLFLGVIITILVLLGFPYLWSKLKNRK